jgi:RND family efflux transporter MFP subunit
VRLVAYVPVVALGLAVAPGPAAAANDGGFIGVIVARVSVTIAPKVEATLESVAVSVGDRVKKDDPVAMLDKRALGQDLQMAQAQLKAAKAERARAAVEAKSARQKHERLKKVGSEFVAAEELDTSKSGADSAVTHLSATAALVAEKQARVEQLKQLVQDAVLRSPLDGAIATRYADAGAQVGPSKPIVRVISMNDLLLRFAVPEDQAASVAIGMPVEVALGAWLGGKTVRGKIEKVAPEVDAASRMVFVEASIDVPGDLRARIPSGMEVRVKPASPAARP